MSIKEWPEQERPRERLLKFGAQSLSDSELLAIFLRTGIKGCSAVDLARTVLKNLGGVNGLLHANQKTFCQTHGMGPAKYAQLQAVLELANRYIGEDIKKKDIMDSPEKTRYFLNTRLRQEKNEVFAVLFLDNRHQVITYESLFNGSIDGASVYPRVVAQRALELNAAALILAHNHPSGINEPSQADKTLTKKLKITLAELDIRVLDHFIIGHGEAYSFAEHGLI
ncbi:MAG: RadC family protein [bacterium]